jgi:hypothetical protein
VIAGDPSEEREKVQENAKEGWLRGRDLNPRPLGYELNVNFQMTLFC